MAEQDRLGTAEVPMTEPEIVTQIQALSSLGWGARSIAKALGVNRKTVTRYQQGALAGVQVRRKARCLDEAGEGRARQLFLGAAEGNAVVVKDMLEQEGYEVSERTVQRMVSSTRTELRSAQLASVLFETEPGQQMQVDFGQKRVVIGGRTVVVHLMAAVLGYSRRIFVKAFLAERAEDWREGIAEAFRHFGGVTCLLIVDNSRCLVAGRNLDTQTVVFHPGLVQLCQDFGCQPRACAPYRARSKGKVESGVKYIKRNALAGREFSSFAELEAHLAAWMGRADRRVHGTTNEVPLERFEQGERAALLPLPSRAVRVRERRLVRQVSNDAFVNIDTVRYSAPYQRVRARVEVAVLEDRVRIYDGQEVIAEHRRSNEPHSVVVDPAHHAGLWRTAASTSTSGGLELMGRSLADYEAVVAGLPHPPGASLPPREHLRSEEGASSVCEVMAEVGGAP